MCVKQTSDDVSRLIRPSQTSSVYRTSSKLETESRAITNYPYLNASLMQAFEESNGGKHVAQRQKMLWIEEGRRE